MLPYSDAKPTGAGDFYFAINATFRFVRQKLGADALVSYWKDLGREYCQPVTALWKAGGLPAVAEYWREFFQAEPGARVTVSENPDEVLLEVQQCPAVAHLRAGGRTIDAWFCRHCYFVSEAMGESVGITVRVEGGNGCCRQRFFIRGRAPFDQEISTIENCS